MRFSEWCSAGLQTCTRRQTGRTEVLGYGSARRCYTISKTALAVLMIGNECRNPAAVVTQTGVAQNFSSAYSEPLMYLDLKLAARRLLASPRRPGKRLPLSSASRAIPMSAESSQSLARSCICRSRSEMSPF